MEVNLDESSVAQNATMRDRAVGMRYQEGIEWEMERERY